MTLLLKNNSLIKSQIYSAGHWLDSVNSKTLDVVNPATSEVIATVPYCGAPETRKMIDAAYQAQHSWARATAKHRSMILRNWFNLIVRNKDDLAYLLTLEQGKPLAEASAELSYGASYVEWFSEEAKRVYGDIIPQSSKDKRLVVIKQPIGVVACITPWNFPNAMLLRKVAPALAAGCAVVCKPANSTPLSALAIAELAEQAELPPGLINIVTGNTEEIGAELTSNPLVRKLTFTGSTPVGKKLIAACSGTVKRTSMELGGNAPFIVFDDADLESAVKGALVSKYRNAGQTCVCSNRLIVQGGIYDQFVEMLTNAVAKLVVGNGLESTTTVGPLINSSAAEDVCSMIDDAVSKGAQCILGGGMSSLRGSFVEPTVLVNVTREMRVFSEEIFGPVAPVFQFDTEDEVIEMANDTEFGLAAYFYTKDYGRIWRVAERLDYGIVGINEGIISNEMAPFGGVKESGNGREGSKYGIDDYLEIKYLCIGGIE
ncbi:MAG: succinate-semialdehyde dehydrogenase (NADP(+)) [Porticoccaceae bacterium]|nr:succinate-semialdehyde dehydrogenase (NADP(+)) [Porticoccaceae bacterium]